MNTTQSSVTIDNICKRCRILSKRKPCDKPCKDWYKLLDKMLKGAEK